MSSPELPENSHQSSAPPPWNPEQPELRPELAQPESATATPAAKPDQRRRRQRRTVVVGLSITALVAGSIIAIVASRQDGPEYAQVCFDDRGNRVDDVKCGSGQGRGSGIYAWYFFARGASIPAVGQNRSNFPTGTTSRPSNGKPSTGFSDKGGTVSRGGFGGGGSGSSGG